jgi:hypothetical protein
MTGLRPAAALAAALLLLAGCGTDAVAGDANAQAPATADAMSADGKCLDAGDPAACRDERLEALASRPAVSDQARVDAEQRFAAALPVLGDAAILRAGGDALAARAVASRAAVLLAEARAALLDRDAAPPPARPAFAPSPEVRAAWSRSRDAACAAYRVARCAARYDTLLDAWTRQVAATEETPVTDTPAARSRFDLPGCERLRASGEGADALLDRHARDFPAVLVGEAEVETVELAPADLDAVAAYLSCLSGLTDGDPSVVESGLSLFASRRHGRAALAALDALARTPGLDGAAAKAFAEQVRGYLKGPRG